MAKADMMNMTGQGPGDVVLEMKRISKSFGAVKALRGVDFELRKGEVMALLGENGAGKSTLVKVLAGLHTPDSGETRIDGKPFSLGSARLSHAASIAVAEQELSVIGALSAAENIFLGGVPFRGPWTRKRLAKKARPYLEAVGLHHLDPSTRVETLAVAERQLIEIARLLATDARILILDEPTAALNDSDIERVKAMVVRLARAGHSIIYVTHRLGEVFEIADRITTLRSGQSSPPVNVSDMTLEKVIEKMIGRPLEEMFPHRASSLGAIALEMQGVTTPALPLPQNLQVRRGEILGIAGQIGSGSEALLRAIAGADIVEGGSIEVHGRAFPRAHSLPEAMKRGVAYCSSDRKLDGIFAELPVSTNIISPSMRRVSPGGLVNRRRIRALTAEVSSQMAIDGSRAEYKVGALSGGNQQKVALGKWLGIAPRVLLVSEPTRGVDVGARAEIYGHLRRLAEEGMAIIFASSDIDEVQGLADRVVTMYRGRQVRVVDPTRVTSHELVRDITHPEEEAA
ncbi:sugar ABC transporter ATP-binding protein [Salipiger bermudensis]|uniref:sugar ABC transporter ATP-binding protein n=1 Tax=Salipiger bermudensis TaxID=344736 RepID=UPI001A8D3460|nr:sugar ABC transporter ATP-binding protein [Salipiger bermudensis]MBN9675089.1 sugar ABC transporter ATP-binding protein [Salipiger bermudensis]